MNCKGVEEIYNFVLQIPTPSLEECIKKFVKKTPYRDKVLLRLYHHEKYNGIVTEWFSNILMTSKQYDEVAKHLDTDVFLGDICGNNIDLVVPLKDLIFSRSADPLQIETFVEMHYGPHTSIWNSPIASLYRQWIGKETRKRKKEQENEFAKKQEI